MKWSKQKQLIESLLADSLKGRLEFHITRYGKGDTWSMSRAWITWDKKELMNFSNVGWYLQYSELAHRIREANNYSDYRDPKQQAGYYAAYNQAEEIMKTRNVFSRANFLAASWEYLESPINDALQSDNPIIRALAMLDRRVGKRRLAKMELIEAEHPIVKKFYYLRCEAEGLQPTSG